MLASRGRKPMLVACAIVGRPHPLTLARALLERGRERVALLHASSSEAPLQLGKWSYVAADPDDASNALDPTVTDRRVLGSELCRVPRWIGVAPYEARRSALERAKWTPEETREAPSIVAPIWHRYPGVVAFDHHTGEILVVGTSAAKVRDLVAFATLALRRPADELSDLRVEVEEPEAPTLHAARIAAARQLIERGDLYQVNLARRLTLRVSRGDGLGLYERLALAAPSGLGSFMDLGDGRAVASSSPELLLRAESRGDSGFDALYTAPIKGTRPRGKEAVGDAAEASTLDADPKERAELAMIIDVERNDLGRIATPGSVRVVAGPRVETHRTVHHRAALLAARTARGLSREAVLAAMLPSGSVTGAPKVRAMEVIASLESARRGLYTGAIGFFAHDGSATLAMAIRTAVLVGDRGEYWSGGGIVADSDPAREVEETRWKALQLSRAVAQNAPRRSRS